MLQHTSSFLQEYTRTHTKTVCLFVFVYFTIINERVYVHGLKTSQAIFGGKKEKTFKVYIHSEYEKREKRVSYTSCAV